MNSITIAIDGYSGCGKSTLAKALAQKLDYNYIDTGAMYRAVTLFGLENGMIDKDRNVNEAQLISSLDKINVEFRFNTHTRSSETYLNGKNVERDIRTIYVSDNVSRVSSIKQVRDKMVALQREMGKNKAVVLDGRDIGTNVFPNAELKLFVTADADVRAQRRLDELRSKGEDPTFEEVKENLLKRDHEDTHRKENPLIQAKDAIVLDNTDLTREQQLEFVLKLITK